MIGQVRAAFATMAALMFVAGQMQTDVSTSIKSSVNLVLVQVAVTQHGSSVSNLQENDFVVLANGKPQKLAVFEEIEAVSAKPELLDLPPNTVQNYISGDGHQDVLILMLDFLNAGFTTSARIRSSLKDVARQFTETRAPVTVLMLSRVGLVHLHSFTSEPENFAKAVEQWSAGAATGVRSADASMVVPGTIQDWASPIAPTQISSARLALQEYTSNLPGMQAAKLDKAAMTLQAVEQISEAFRGIPGRKKLVWVSTGFPTAIVEESSFKSIAAIEPMETEFAIREKSTRAWKALSDANIVVYPIDSNGVTVPGWDEHSSAAHGPADSKFSVAPEISTNVPSLLEVAQKTGGQNCDLAPAACIKLAQADADHYYLLGFYLNGDEKPGWRKLKVTVNQPRLVVRARDGFFVGGEGVPKSGTEVSKDAIITALASPMDYTSVPMKLHWSRVSMKGLDTQVELAITSPPGGITAQPEDGTMNLDFLAFVRPLGKTEGRSIPAILKSKLSPLQRKSLATDGFFFRKQVTLPPDRYEVRVLLRDNVSKKMGTISTIIDLTPPKA